MNKLALQGGEKIIDYPLEPYRTIGQEEKDVALEVLDSGVLSDFIATHSEKFLGGVRVQALEESWANKFGTKYAVSMNSATSCLGAAIGACGIGPGDEVIVSPYSMTASATAILFYNAIPVFADVERRTFNLDPESVKKCITERTKGIMCPNIFGHPARLNELKEIASDLNIPLIEDNAQSITALYKGIPTGTIGDIGIFSLNTHKHIQTGEGGIAVTDDPELAERMRLIRNHAEAVVGARGTANLTNMVGYNFRLGELEAAIAKAQLSKVDQIVEERRAIAHKLDDFLSDIPELTTPVTEPDCTHAYYLYALLYNKKEDMPHRDIVVQALQSEGVPISSGYVKPIYLEPLYQERIAYGQKGCPFSCDKYNGNVSYERGICPVVESLKEDDIIVFPTCAYNYSERDLENISKAFHKVFSSLGELKNL